MYFGFRSSDHKESIVTPIGTLIGRLIGTLMGMHVTSPSVSDSPDMPKVGGTKLRRRSNLYVPLMLGVRNTVDLHTTKDFTV